MKENRNYLDDLNDILDAISKARQFVQGMSFEQFADDDKTVFAVIRALEIIGEAAKRLPSEIKAQEPSLLWREMAGMRDKLTHQYFGVNLEVVWETLVEDLPPLEEGVHSLLKQTRNSLSNDDDLAP